MLDQESGARMAVVRLPAEIDVSNADEAGEQLRTAIAPGVTILVADLTATTFCDSAGIRQLTLAYDKAVASGAQLRLAVAEGGLVERTVKLVGLAHLLPLYPTVEAALAVPAEPGR